MEEELEQLVAFIRETEPEYLLMALWWVQNSGLRHLIDSGEPDDKALEQIDDRVSCEYPALFEYAVTHARS